jgi:hypothetical protein
MAQVTAGSGSPGINTPPVVYGGDVLGAHNGYGRGCVMCHAPHSGAMGNGLAASGDPQNGMVALWGQNLTPLYGASLAFSGDTSKTKYPVTLPSSGTLTSSFTEGSTIILFCLSCHDGVTAVVSMMKGKTVETLPVVSGNAPTLLAAAAPSGGWAYANDHPVGPNAYVSCNGSVSGGAVTTPVESGHNWDCTGGGNNTTKISMTGPAATQFLVNYPASFWNGSYPLATFSSTGVVNGVTCTTCHNQHSMTVYSVGGVNYTTMFFLKGYYNPYSGGNNVAQFCRNCHGGVSNEMGGLMNIPTT